MNMKPRGVALLTALFFGVLCLGMATGLLLQVPRDIVGTSMKSRQLKASYVADAAIRAVNRAGTLPVSPDPDVYNQLKDITLTVEPRF